MIFHSLDVPLFQFHPSPTEGDLGCSQVSAMWVKLLWTSVCSLLCGNKFSAPLSQYHRVQLPDGRESERIFVFTKSPKCLPQQPYHLLWMRVLIVPNPCQHLVLSVLDFRESNWCTSNTFNGKKWTWSSKGGFAEWVIPLIKYWLNPTT